MVMHAACTPALVRHVKALLPSAVAAMQVQGAQKGALPVGTVDE